MANFSFAKLIDFTKDKISQKTEYWLAFFKTFFEGVALVGSKILNNPGKSLSTVGSILNWGTSAICQVVIYPGVFYYSANYLLSIVNTNNWLTEWGIQFFKNTSFRALSVLENIPIVGMVFTQSVLPVVVASVIGLLLYSNCNEIWTEQKKLVKPQKRALEKQFKDHPEGKLKDDLKEKLDSMKTWFGKMQFHISTIASLGPQEEKKAIAMRFLLSLGVPAFVGMFASLYGVPGATILYWTTRLSVVANFMPFGLMGALVAVQNGFNSIYQTWNPVDHNARREKEKEEREALEAQNELEQKRALNKSQGINRLTDDEPGPTNPRASTTNATQISSEAARRASLTQAEEIRLKRLENLLQSKKITLEAFEEEKRKSANRINKVLEPSPTPVVFSNAQTEPQPVQFSSTPKPTEPENSADNTPKPGKS